MREKISGCFQSGPFPLRDRDAELSWVPVNDDGRQQVQPCDAKVLTFCGTVKFQ